MISGASPPGPDTGLIAPVGSEQGHLSNYARLLLGPRAADVQIADAFKRPVVATTTRLGETVGGLTSDKEAEMTLVILQVRDGRRALLAFTGLDALQSWQPDARPVPVTIDIAAQAATSEELTVVLIDVAGPHPFVIEGEVLAELAAGHRLVELPDGQFGWIVPAQD